MDKFEAQSTLNTVAKQVVLCADDYALNAPVSQGIVALAQMGRLSATSVMSLSPRWAEDARALREARASLGMSLDVGLHLDWTSSFAIQAGHGSSLGVVMSRALLGLYKVQSLQDEMHRQLDAFEQHWQAPPDHIDGHQHIQQFNGFRDALAEVLLRRYGANKTSQIKRPWLRISQVAQAGLKAKIISTMGAANLHAWAAQKNWPVVSPLSGAYGFDGNAQDYAQRMRGWLSALPAKSVTREKNETTEIAGLIMCHPAASAQADDAIGPARASEFAYLASDDFVKHLHDANVQLVRGSLNAQALNTEH